MYQDTLSRSSTICGVDGSCNSGCESVRSLSEIAQKRTQPHLTSGAMLCHHHQQNRHCDVQVTHSQTYPQYMYGAVMCIYNLTVSLFTRQVTHKITT